MTTPRRLWRRIGQVATAAGVVLLAAVALVAAPGSIAVRDRPGGGRSAWLARCARHQPRQDRVVLDRCARVDGRVLVVRHTGTGVNRETHLLVTAHLHLLVVKLRPDVATPAIGARATFEGALVRGRDGLREVDAWAERA